MFGIFLRRIPALFAVCLTAAFAADSARPVNESGRVSITGMSVTTTFTTATFNFSTSTATGATISTGIDQRNLVDTVDRVKRSHVVTVRGLMPVTNYRALVTVAPKHGKAAKTWISFNTPTPGSGAATVTSSGGQLLLNGQRWFGILGETTSLCPDSQTVQQMASLGIRAVKEDNTNVTAQCSGIGINPPIWASELHDRFDGKLWLATHDPRQAQALQTLPELMTWQAGATDPAANENPCISSTLLFDAVSKAAGKSLVVAARGLGAHDSNGRRNCVTPNNVAMFFWTVVAAGGKGVQYLTAVPLVGDFVVDQKVADQIVKQTAQTAVLAPVLLMGKRVAVRYGGETDVRYGGWSYGGHIYVVAVNTNNRSTTSTFRLPSLTSGSVKVMWEGRSLRFRRGLVSDNFAPQAVHIYKVTTK